MEMKYSVKYKRKWLKDSVLILGNEMLSIVVSVRPSFKFHKNEIETNIVP